MRNKPPASLRALIEHAIDYAGLFPPANLQLEPALRNHASYMWDENSWMLGAFILPVGQFESAAAHLAASDGQQPIRIAALGSKAENEAECRRTIDAAAEAIGSWNAKHGAAAAITQLELPLGQTTDESVIVHVRSTFTDLDLAVFLETSADQAENTIALLARANDASSRPLGFKLRTGGVIASAFPSSIQIARALVAAAAHRVPIKFTAGLHHPIRLFHPSVQTKMHGFINVLGAGVLAAEYGWDVQQTAAMLQDEEAGAFSFDDEALHWREWSLTTEQIRERRALVTSFGSCSFDEPRDDLRALHLL